MSGAGVTIDIGSEVIKRLPSVVANLEPADDCLLSAEDIPDWLNKAFLEGILRKHFNDEALKVNCLKIQQCGGKGESYASEMFRVGTYFCDGKNPENGQFRSFIVKTLPQNEMSLEKLGSDNYNVQSKEMEMYADLLPQFKKVLMSIGEAGDIFPGAIAVCGV